MDLQEASELFEREGTSFNNSIGTVQFNRVLGSIASSLPAPGEEITVTQTWDHEESLSNEGGLVEEVEIADQRERIATASA